MTCKVCGREIPEERLEALPDTVYCVECSQQHAPVKVYDAEVLCAKASLSCQNGFAK